MPIIEGYHTDGLFNRSAAINTAARIAGDWDVAVIIDADVICSPDRVKEAVELAARTGSMILPHSTRYDLSRKASEAVRRGVLAADRGRGVHPAATRTARTTPTTATRRCRPWSSSAATPVGRHRRLRRAVPRLGLRGHRVRRGGRDVRRHHPAWTARCSTSGTRRRARASRAPRRGRSTRHAARRTARPSATPPQSAACNDQARPVLSAGAGRIPRILHRVVPEAPNSIADGWWARFEELHPDWELRTHRDPLQAAEWPLTRGPLGQVRQRGAVRRPHPARGADHAGAACTSTRTSSRCVRWTC